MEFSPIHSDRESEDGEYATEDDSIDFEVDEERTSTDQPFESSSDDERVVSNMSGSDDETLLSQKMNELDGIWEQKSRKYDEIHFSEECGPKLPPNTSSPSEIFLCLFSDTLIDILVKQTNLYCEQLQKPFEPTTKEEMLTFLGINIMMGLKKLPSIRDYWSSNVQLRDSYISSIISRNRFFFLLYRIHLNDNESMPRKGDPTYDKLYKVAPMINHLSENFLKFYKPTKEQAIDESMIRFKGRSTLKQYLPQKPIKRGFKVWVRADKYGLSISNIYWQNCWKSREIFRRKSCSRFIPCVSFQKLSFIF